MNGDISFGKLVREHRIALGLTQAELSIRVSCATITVRKIEADDLRPSSQIAERLAMALTIPQEDRSNFIHLGRTALRNTPSPSPIPIPPPLPEEIGEEDLSGRAVRGYALGERIGAGGYGAVYQATQPALGREVAVKVILPQYANQPDFIRSCINRRTKRCFVPDKTGVLSYEFSFIRGGQAPMLSPLKPKLAWWPGWNIPTSCPSMTIGASRG